MNYFLRFCFVILICVFNLKVANSHAVVTNHSLKISAVKPNEAGKVDLTFNSKIETSLSQVFLVRAGDRQEALNFSKGQEQGHMAIDVPALEPGKYALKLKVFAADGHLTEDVIHFKVEEDKTAKPKNSNSQAK